MQDMLRRYGPGLTLMMCLLVAFWLLMLVIVPNITLFEQSFQNCFGRRSESERVETADIQKLSS